MSESTDPSAEAAPPDDPDDEPTLEADLAVIADVAAELEAVESELVTMDQERDGEANPT